MFFIRILVLMVVATAVMAEEVTINPPQAWIIDSPNQALIHAPVMPGLKDSEEPLYTIIDISSDDRHGKVRRGSDDKMFTFKTFEGCRDQLRKEAEVLLDKSFDTILFSFPFCTDMVNLNHNPEIYTNFHNWNEFAPDPFFYIDFLRDKIHKLNK